MSGVHIIMFNIAYRYRLPLQEIWFSRVTLLTCGTTEDNAQQLARQGQRLLQHSAMLSSLLLVASSCGKWFTLVVTWHWRLSPRMTTLYLSQTCCLHSEFREWSTTGHRFSQTTLLTQSLCCYSGCSIISSFSILFSSQILHFYNLYSPHLETSAIDMKL